MVSLKGQFVSILTPNKRNLIKAVTVHVPCQCIGYLLHWNLTEIDSFVCLSVEQSVSFIFHSFFTIHDSFLEFADITAYDSTRVRTLIFSLKTG